MRLWAQAAPAGSSAPPFPWQFPIWAVMFLMFYLVLIRPQQQQKKKAEQMLREIKRGDKVVTSGGIIGTVMDVDDQRAVLRTGGDIKLEFVKSAIVQVLGEKS